MDVEKEEVVVEGNWTVDFQLTYQDASIYLPTGQTFHAGTNEALTGTIEELRISPLSLCVTYAYEIDEEKVTAAYDPAMTTEPKEEWVSNEIEYQTLQTHVFLHLKDGSTKEVGSYGDMYSKKGKQILSGTFSEITPLDTIESISIGDLTIPVPQS